MKTPIIPRGAAIFAAGSVLATTALPLFLTATAQESAPKVHPTPAAASATSPSPATPALPDAPATPVEPVPPPRPTAAGASSAPPAVRIAVPVEPPRATPIELPRSTPLSRQPSPGGLPGLPAGVDSTVNEGAGARSSDSDELFSPTPARSGPPRTIRIGGGAGETVLRVESTLANTILNEEVLGSPEEAVRHYEAVVTAFDSQRASAAQAVFRLGESYRKLGRLDEARIQYARILREFVDFPDLAALSQQQLAQGLPRQQAGVANTVLGNPTPVVDASGWARTREAAARVTEEERALLQEEIALLQDQMAQTQMLIEQGTVPKTSLVPLQREILQLKRQLLHRQNFPAPTSNEAVDPSNPFAAPAFDTTPEPATPPTGGAPAADPGMLQRR